MRKMAFVLLVMGFGYAVNFDMLPGSCITDNSSNNTYCSIVPDLALNVTLFANETNNVFHDPAYNITFTARGNQTIIQVVNNTSLIYNNYCNATSLTIWANSSMTVNNATVTCLANSTVAIQNITQPYRFCNYTANFTPSASFQFIRDASIGLDLLVNPIDPKYCNENVNRRLGDLEIYRSDRCNITLIGNTTVQIINQSATQNITICPVVENVTAVTCPVCQVAQECPAFNATESVEYADLMQRNMQLSAMIDSPGGLQEKVTMLNKKVQAYQDVPGMVGEEAKKQIEPVKDIIFVFLLCAIGAGIYLQTHKKGHDGFMTANNKGNIQKLKDWGREKMADLEKRRGK